MLDQVDKLVFRCLEALGALITAQLRAPANVGAMLNWQRLDLARRYLQRAQVTLSQVDASTLAQEPAAPPAKGKA